MKSEELARIAAKAAYHKAMESAIKVAKNVVPAISDQALMEAIEDAEDNARAAAKKAVEIAYRTLATVHDDTESEDFAELIEIIVDTAKIDFYKNLNINAVSHR